MSKRDGVFFRNNSFYISWQDAQGNRKKRKTSAANLNEARMIRSEELRKAEQIKLGVLPAVTDKSFAVVGKEYLEYQSANITDAIHRRETDIFRMYLTPFFQGPLADVKRVSVNRYLLKRHKDGAAPATIRKELNILKHMLSFAVEQEYLPGSPAVGVKGPKVPKIERAFVPQEKFPALLNASPEWLKPILLFSVATGFRRRNVLELEWRDIDLQNRLVTQRESKTGTMQSYPLNDLAIAVLKAVMVVNALKLPAFKGKARVFHFVGTPTNVSVRVRRIAKKVGMPDIHFHSLRHTFASWAVMNGNDLSAVQKWMGHTTPRMTAEYAHLSPSFMRKELQQLNGAFAGLLPAATEGQPGDATGTNGD